RIVVELRRVDRRLRPVVHRVEDRGEGCLLVVAQHGEREDQLLPDVPEERALGEGRVDVGSGEMRFVLSGSGRGLGHAESMTSATPDSPASPPTTGVFRALRHRNYRLFFSGQTVSLVGTWITRVATSWLVYRLTGSVLLLGVVGFFGQIPTLILAPFSGVLVDRWNRHRILVVTQVLSMLQSFALAGLSFAGIITVTDVLLLQAAQGIINAFDTPARQSFVVEMVNDRGDVP